MNIASFIDHTLLKSNAKESDIRKLCRQARKFRFRAVCVNLYYAGLCRKLLKGSGVRVCVPVGFPLGAVSSGVKAFESRDAVRSGADEIDMVSNIGALKSGEYKTFFNDIREVRKATRGKILKVIIETAYLTRSEKIKACTLAKKAGVDFVKTSTGFAPKGATVSDIKLLRKVLGPEAGIKASGGIKTFRDALRMIKAGADRIGTSNSVAIMREMD